MKVRKSRVERLVHVDLKSRRMFLKSLGGFTLAIPFLPSLLTSSRLRAATITPPLRYVQITSPHGGLKNVSWFGGNAPTTNFSMSDGTIARVDLLQNLASGINGLSPVFGPTYNPLLPFTNILVGVDQPYYYGHSRTNGYGAFVNAKDPKVEIDPVDQGPLHNLIGETPSLDQVFSFAGGNGIYGANAPSIRSINISVAGGPTTSWGRKDYNLLNTTVSGRDSISSTSGVFSTLFGALPRSTANNSTVSTNTTNPLINLVNEFWPSGKDLMSLLSPTDRSLLDQLFQLASDASTSYSSTTPLGTGANYCNSDPRTDVSSSWGTDGKQLEVLADIISMAFKCDLTRIVTISIGDFITSANWHSLAHDSSNTDAGQASLVKIHKQIADSLVTKLGTSLMGVTDPLDSTASLLKNSLIMWMHENKASHDNWSTPTFMLGEAGGRIKTGLLADMRNLNTLISSGDASGDALYQGQLINRLWISMFYAMGINPVDYEIARGGGAQSKSLTNGYGHILNDILSGSWHNSNKVYNTTKFAAPWDFLTKNTTVWG